VPFARQALLHLKGEHTAQRGQEGPVQVLLPLGYDRRRVQVYKVIKLSAFLFRTPDQREKVGKAMNKFADTYGCGLELLALRRSHGSRRQGSIQDVARSVYHYVRSGGDNLAKKLNLTRPFQELEKIHPQHAEVLKRRRQELRELLYHTIDADNLEPAAALTGLFVEDRNVILVE
jgi:hypothetical protein